MLELAGVDGKQASEQDAVEIGERKAVMEDVRGDAGDEAFGVSLATGDDGEHRFRERHRVAGEDRGSGGDEIDRLGGGEVAGEGVEHGPVRRRDMSPMFDAGSEDLRRHVEVSGVEHDAVFEIGGEVRHAMCPDDVSKSACFLRCGPPGPDL